MKKNKVLENRYRSVQSKSYLNECKNCNNKRSNGSSYCQKCSDNHKK